jgi:asparagine synthase (glutamine-hydrolysing)
MCGIFGFARFDGHPVSPSLLSACVDSLSHRGPDSEGVVGWDTRGQLWTADAARQDLTVGMGHRRLAIFDLSPAGAQPMPGKRGEWIVHNGEVFNFPELREELCRAGHEFFSDSDTEVILAAYAQWGPECVERFNGMWSFVLYDPAEHAFFCSRDRLGIKPFYYTLGDEGFCFASEVEAILRYLGTCPVIDSAELAKYLLYRDSDASEATLYEGIRELRGGHSAMVDLESGAMKTWRYWQLPDEPLNDPGEDAALDEFSHIFEDAVRLRLRADVPVAVTLSGGVDSSAVTVAASRTHNQQVRTYTSSFPLHPRIDESAYAKKVAQACGVEHVLVEPNLSRVLDEVPSLTRHQAMPFGSLSLYVQWEILSRIRQDGIPAVLSGQGADELFLGYETFHVARVLSLWPDVHAMVKAAVLGSRRSRLGLPRMLTYLLYFGMPRLRRARLKSQIRRIYTDEILKHLPEARPMIDTDLARLQRRELEGGHLSRLLRFDDRTASAHGMETRLPFLDYRLVEFAVRLPWKYKIEAGWTKWLLRRYLARHLPSSIAWRRNKLGFNAPTADWTERLIERWGREVRNHAFARQVLRQEVELDATPAHQRWATFNVLHLAYLMDWRELS